MKKNLLLLAILYVQFLSALGQNSNFQLKDRLSQIKRPSVVIQDADPIYKGQPYSKDLEKEAKNGSSAFQTELGLCYLFGNGIQVDNKKAQSWLEKAEAQNNVNAMFWLGYMYDTNRAKKVKLASFFKKLGMQQGSIRSLPKDEEAAYKRIGAELYERASSFRQPDALYMRYRKEHNKKFLNLAAVNGSVKAKYDMGVQFLDEFYSSSLLDTTKLTLAKGWFEEAQKYGHPNADAILQKISEMEMAIAKIKQEEEERLRQEAIAEARRDSIARAEAEQRRKQDSIDYATGKKLPPYEYLVSDCSFGGLYALAKNDVLLYYGKTNLDKLDQEIYKRSDQYKADLAEFQNKKTKKHAHLRKVDNIYFEADGFVFNVNEYSTMQTIGMVNYYIEDNGLLFPIQPSARYLNIYSERYIKFKTDDIDLLQKIRLNKNDLSILYIVKPSLSVDFDYIAYYIDNEGKTRHKTVGLTDLLSVYLINEKTEETLADLSQIVRKTTYQAEKQRITNAVRTYNAKRKANAPKYHSVPKQKACEFCWGTGGTNGNRCVFCHGRGYTMEHYY